MHGKEAARLDIAHAVERQDLAPGDPFSPSSSRACATLPALASGHSTNSVSSQGREGPTGKVPTSSVTVPLGVLSRRP
ncbi:hypothetical protein ACXXDK_18305 (plasmid) [Deinococcus sp. PESE-38]